MERGCDSACMSPPRLHTHTRTHTNSCLVHYHFTMTRMANLLTETELSPELNLNGVEGEEEEEEEGEEGEEEEEEAEEEGTSDKQVSTLRPLFLVTMRLCA